MSASRRALGLVSLAAVLANSTWFSATAVIPALERDWELGPSGAAWLVVAVQLGFIAGNVGSALLNLADRIPPRRLIAGAAIAAAAANAGLLGSSGLASALPSRFLVGVAVAGVYAPSVRLVATYFTRGRGMATGVVVGALTLGAGLPHLVRGAGDVPWQATIAATSLLALLAAVVVGSVREGPSAPAGTPPLDMRAAVRALRDRPLRMTTLGYMGHMWELYALWAWLPAFFSASRGGAGRLVTGIVAFAAIGVAGLAGSIVAGRVSDRIGRASTTVIAMLASGACCVVSPLAFTAPTPVLAALLLVWGATVIADSAQFSAATTELAEPRYAGSALTLQLALGFALTIASIRLVPIAADAIGWRYALLPLAAGPLGGTVAMLRRNAERVTLGRGGRQCAMAIPAPIQAFIDDQADRAPGVYTDLRAVVFNGTLKRSPERSHTDGLLDISKGVMERVGVSVDEVRTADFEIPPGVWPDMTEHGYERDDFPRIYRQLVVRADIILIAGPIWLGDQSSLTRKIIERLYAYSGDVNDAGQWSYYGKVGGALTTGNEDGGKHVSAQVLYALQHIGLTIPPQADAYWNGEAGPGPSYLDPVHGGERNAWTTRNTVFMTWNLLHLARMLKDSGGIPAYGNDTRDWDLEHPDHPNPEYRVTPAA